MTWQLLRPWLCDQGIDQMCIDPFGVKVLITLAIIMVASYIIGASD